MSAVKLIPTSGGGSVSLAPPSSTSGADITITMPTTSQGLGKILQVQQAVKTDTQSFQSESFADISGLSLSITPSSSSNKILCMASLYIGSGGGGATAKINFVRGSTNIGQPSTSVSHKASMFLYTADAIMATFTTSFLDSPSTTSATTYKLQLGADSASTATYINRYHGADNYNGISSLTVMEVAG